jgi:predicted nucleic acid-binding protein
MRTDLALLDTNVLVYSFYRDQPSHQASASLLEKAQSVGARLCIVPQVLAEFYAAVTNPRRVSSPFSAEEALTEIENLRALPGLTLLPIPLDVVDQWTRLAGELQTTGSHIYDVQLVAAMLGNGVKSIYTFNTKDFEPLIEVAGIEVLEPPAP